MSTIGARLDETRADDRRRWLLSVVGVVVGLALAWVHWLGFVVGGALVALPQVSFPRGMLAGLGFGVLSVVVFTIWFATVTAFGTYLAMGQVLVVSAAAPLVFAVLGSLARGLR